MVLLLRKLKARRKIMTANLDDIIAYFHRNCADLLRYVNSDSGTTAYAAEAEILSQVIAIGNTGYGRVFSFRGVAWAFVDGVGPGG
jgi:hypothetical protein